MEEISLGDLRCEKLECVQIKFLKIPLKYEFKTVEVCTSNDKVANLKSKNDFLQQKYFQELKLNEIEKARKKKRLAEMREEKNTHYTSNSECQTTERVPTIPEHEDVISSSVASDIPQPQESFEGILRLKAITINPKKTQQPFIDIPLLMYGIEAQLKNDEDYYMLLENMKDWETQNLDYISELTDYNESIFNTPNKTGNTSIYAKTKNCPGEFDFGEDEAGFEMMTEGGVDFDEMIRNKNKSLDKAAKEQLLKKREESQSEKSSKSPFRKFLCCF